MASLNAAFVATEFIITVNRKIIYLSNITFALLKSGINWNMTTFLQVVSKSNMMNHW